MSSPYEREAVLGTLGDAAAITFSHERFGNIAALAKALAKAQGTIEDATKDSVNPHFRAKYSSLSSVRDAIRGPLSENGIAYVQLARCSDRAVEVETLLIHESGQSIGDTLRVPLQQQTPQAVGSALSYARRYSLMSIVGLAADDDDGEGAHGRNGNSLIAPRRKSSAQTNRDGDFDRLRADLADVQSAVGLETLRKEYEQNVYPGWPKRWVEEAAPELFEARAAELSSGAELRETLEASAEAETRAEYIREAHDFIDEATNGDALLRWWNSDIQKANRRRFGLQKAESDELKSRVLVKQAALAPNILQAG